MIKKQCNVSSFGKLTNQRIENKQEIPISERSEASEDKNHRQKTVPPTVPMPAPLGPRAGRPAGQSVKQVKQMRKHCIVF